MAALALERRHLDGYRLAVVPMWLNGHFHIHFYPGLHGLVAAVRPDIFHIDEEAFNLATFQAMRLGVAAGARCCFYNYANIARRYPPPFAHSSTITSSMPPPRWSRITRPSGIIRDARLSRPHAYRLAIRCRPRAVYPDPVEATNAAPRRFVSAISAGWCPKKACSIGAGTRTAAGACPIASLPGAAAKRQHCAPRSKPGAG